MSIYQIYNKDGELKPFLETELGKDMFSEIKALQSKAGGFSLEDMKNAIQYGITLKKEMIGISLLSKFVKDKSEEFIQSLTKEQPQLVESNNFLKECFNRKGSGLANGRCVVCNGSGFIDSPIAIRPKGEIVIECEMEYVKNESEFATGGNKLETGHSKIIKLTSGQPTLTFK